MSGYLLAVPFTTASNKIRVRYNHTMVIRGEREKGKATSKSEKQAGDIIGVRFP